MMVVHKNESKRLGLSINTAHQLAHRVAFVLHKGKIPKGKLVCHHCDNPPCRRPCHLFLGTQKQNIQDMISKGRRVGNKKLTAEKVVKIRRLSIKGVSSKKLATKFNISRSNIRATFV